MQVRGVVACAGGLKLSLKDGSEVQMTFCFRFNFMIAPNSWYVVQVEAEAVILATGYHYNFPFLTPECGVSVENRVVQPLYKHLISIANPSLSFIGLPVQVLFKLNHLKTIKPSPFRFAPSLSLTYK